MESREIQKFAWRLFGISFLIYSLFAFERLLEPSPHFHFTDLAHSFLDGRLDTDTPRIGKTHPMCRRIFDARLLGQPPTRRESDRLE